jgi:hypothetical protein
MPGISQGVAITWTGEVATKASDIIHPVGHCACASADENNNPNAHTVSSSNLLMLTLQPIKPIWPSLTACYQPAVMGITI